MVCLRDTPRLPWDIPESVYLHPTTMSHRIIPLAAVALAALAPPHAFAADPSPPGWKHLSSRTGDLAAHPGGSTQQTGAVVADFDGDGVNDFILSFRHKAPALLFYRR